MISREELWRCEGKQVEIKEGHNRFGKLMYVNEKDIIIQVERLGGIKYNIRIPIKSIKKIKQC